MDRDLRVVLGVAVVAGIAWMGFLGVLVAGGGRRHLVGPMPMVRVVVQEGGRECRRILFEACRVYLVGHWQWLLLVLGTELRCLLVTWVQVPEEAAMIAPVLYLWIG